jgi:DNA-binding MarR family transcriptional regulator
VGVVKQLSLPPVPSEVEVHVALLADRLLHALRHHLDKHGRGGLRPSHIRLISCVPSEGATLTELAGPLFMTKQAVGQFVTHLRTTGHLELRPDDRDRRRRVVVRTGLGDRTVAEVNAAIADVERQWADQVGQEDYAVFRRVLRQLTDT